MMLVSKVLISYWKRLGRNEKQLNTQIISYLRNIDFFDDIDHIISD